MKFVGTAQMEVVYDYRSVNGRAVGAVSELQPSTPVRTAAQSGW